MQALRIILAVPTVCLFLALSFSVVVKAVGYGDAHIAEQQAKWEAAVRKDVLEFLISDSMNKLNTPDEKVKYYEAYYNMHYSYTERLEIGDLLDAVYKYDNYRLPKKLEKKSVWIVERRK